MQKKVDENDPKNWPEFKKAEKHYKVYQKKKTDFSELIDLRNPEDYSKYKDICDEIQVEDPVTKRKIRAYKFHFPQGLYLVKDALNIEDSLNLTKRCLNEYIDKPHRTNLFIYEEENKKDNEPLPTYDISKFLINDPKKYYFNKKIRWSNVGYQYNWNERMYPKQKTSVPPELAKFPIGCIEMMKFDNYIPETVIINYYDDKNYMGGHLDDGELDQISPIISYSLGLSCVFLIGGEKKEIKPHALRLDSGDICIMSGYSRRCYHGVPRILEGSFDKEKYMNWVKENEPELYENHSKGNVKADENGFFENDYIHCINYLNEDRLNFNFRQVFLRDEKGDVIEDAKKDDSVDQEKIQIPKKD